ncbi:NADH dehydrogenase subunit 5 (mitochondrion) [Pocillopora damicornis]|uniref:NADH-ubiquinone oxidoreductase chain 5 n=29 Tax=Pocilloporidae TaxID=46729 RepID=A7XPC7_POCDA|nr:NADH dehydrogenase subunit 5 [Pocillopora damicornis]YP_001456717.1 NADH dehydrogenase subunit 5 [Pocillopora grandis]ABO77147.1 NADH dehydrogenase subunit 5 [Pocillopora damicornis]ABO77161.1 NADH dehydrogenase subunit 5 [Pocillopora grandis]
MYLLVLFFPLIGAVLTGCFGRKIGERGAGILTSSCLVFSLSYSFLIAIEVLFNSTTTYLKLWKWFDSGLFVVFFGFQFDGLVVIMLFVVFIVSTLVHIFSIAYMRGDPHIPRFMTYLSLFTFLMVLLVTSDNFLQLFIGWEGVGLCSYLLINFWLTRLEANRAAIKAMLVNRIGDIGLLLAMFLLWDLFGSLDFSTIFNSIFFSNQIFFICLFLFFGVMGKSAQLGLHTWLPDAMEGPTPVSALIHAATMVTAGVFLLIRASPLFDVVPLILIIISIVGVLTVFIAGTIGLVQNDLKKIIAYSTCSQLGYMVVACGLSHYAISLFHLMNHAFFKALLFLSAGSLIHAVIDEQDIRKMGGLLSFLPLTYVFFLIGSFSLMGFPFLTGFYSKDLILEFAFGQFYLIFVYWLGCFSVLLTIIYSIRLIYLVFLSNINLKRANIFFLKEGEFLFLIPLGILTLGSVFWGYLSKEIIWSFQIDVFSILSLKIKIFPILFCFIGLFGTIFFFFFFSSQIFGYPLQVIGSSVFSLYNFFGSAWQINFFFNFFFIKKIYKIGHLITNLTIDKGLLEVVGPRGVVQFFIFQTQKLSSIQSGLVFNYALVFFLGILFLIFAL